MFERKRTKKTYILWSTLMGMISFILGGVVASIVIVRYDNYILATVITGLVGGSLMGIFLSMKKKIGNMAIAGVFGVPLGLVLSFFLVEGFGALFPWIGAYFEGTNILDIIAAMVMGITVGSMFGATIYGRRAVLLFAIICGLAGLPAGILVAAFNLGYPIKFWLENLLSVFGKIDLNFLAIVIFQGIGLGLSIGLKKVLKG